MKRDAQTSILQAAARYVRRQIDPVLTRLAGIEEKAIGAHAACEQMKMALASLPVPKDGRDGKDAQPVDVDAVADLVVAKMLDSGRVKTLAALEAAEAVAEHFRAHPVRDGKDGAQGPAGEPGRPGERGEKGADGIGMASALIDREGRLVVTMTDGSTKELGPVVGRDGERGADGLSMANVVREYDAAAHEVVERWTVGGAAKELRYPAGGLRPGGFWNAGEKTLAGQVKTHDGHAWVALRDTAEEPTIKAVDWVLFVRKGRDGRDGRNGRDLGPPEPVKLGSSNG